MTNSENFENCLVCYEFLYEARQALPCQHLVCKLCYKQMKSLETVDCPYCRQRIQKWEYNRSIAAKVRQLDPRGWKRKKIEEKTQKLIRKERRQQPTEFTVDIREYILLHNYYSFLYDLMVMCFVFFAHFLPRFTIIMIVLILLVLLMKLVRRILRI